jgi:CBS domain-containing protein
MYEFLSYRVRDVMTPNPVTIAPTACIGEAQALFGRHEFNALPVVDECGRLVAVLSKLDILKAFAFTPESIIPHYDEIMHRCIGEVMTRDPVSVDPEWPLTRVLERMLQTRNKSFPVVQEGRLVGVIAREDIMKALLRAAAHSVPSGWSDVIPNDTDSWSFA